MDTHDMYEILCCFHRRIAYFIFYLLPFEFFAALHCPNDFPNDEICQRFAVFSQHFRLS